MPQVDIVIFFSQTYFTTILFYILFYILFQIYLPLMQNIFFFRWAYLKLLRCYTGIFFFFSNSYCFCYSNLVQRFYNLFFSKSTGIFSFYLFWQFYNNYDNSYLNYNNYDNSYSELKIKPYNLYFLNTMDSSNLVKLLKIDCFFSFLTFNKFFYPYLLTTSNIDDSK